MALTVWNSVTAVLWDNAVLFLLGPHTALGGDCVSCGVPFGLSSLLAG